MKTIMKYLLQLLLLALPTIALAQQSTERQCDVNVKVLFYTPDIVRVTKIPLNSAGAQQSLVVILEPQNVEVKTLEKGGAIIYQSDKLKVTVNKNGSVSFAALKGAKLLDEAAYNF